MEGGQRLGLFFLFLRDPLNDCAVATCGSLKDGIFKWEKELWV